MKLNSEDAHQLQNVLLEGRMDVFIRKVFETVSPGDRYIHGWHIDCIAEHLHAVYKGEIRRLIVNIQPRALKSIMISVAFPAWILGKDPTEQIISASYAQGLALKNSADTRHVIESDWYKDLFTTRIAKDQNEKRKFKTAQGGMRLATSVGGTLTGEGGNYLLMDDPTKPDEALSKVVRDSTNDWFDQVFMTRENNPKSSKAVVIMQRLHEEDLTGHLIEKGGWEHLVLPTIAEQKTIIDINGKTFTREQEDLLHPDREDWEQIEVKKREVGEYAWAGQYQQRPAPLGGGEFRREWLIHEDGIRPTGMNRYILVDPAGGKESSKKKDYTSMIVWGLAADANYYLLDAIRDKDLNPRDRQETLFELVKKWQPRKVGYEEYGGFSDIPDIKEKQKEQNFRFNIESLGGTKLSKEDRIRRMIPLFMDGRVILPEYGFYVKKKNGEIIDIIRAFVEEEYLMFPVAKNDDMFDAMSRILDPDFVTSFPKMTPKEKKFRKMSEQREESPLWI